VKQIASVIPFAPKKKKESSPLSKRQNQIIKLSGQIAERTREEAGALAFMSRLLIMVNLPYRDPGKECKNWSRQNGKVSIDVVSAYKKSTGWVGIPYGTYPRLILIYLITQAVKTQSPMLSLGKSFGDFLTLLGLKEGGYQYKQIKKQLERILSASFSWTYETDKMQSRTNIQVSHQSQLWWDPKSPEQQALWESNIKLNTDFFNEIIRNAVPLDFRVVSVLKNSPLGLDLFMFIAWRTFKIDKPVYISWESLQEQLGGQYIDVKVFARDCRYHVNRIQAICPNLNVKFLKGRLCLYPSYPL
jgi:Plasmid encoded RepA protein